MVELMHHHYEIICHKPKVKTFVMKHGLPMEQHAKKNMLQFQENPTRI